MQNVIRIVFATCTLAPSLAWADTLQVPSEFATIQAAIDAAVNGDVVLIADGVYTGEGNTAVDFLGKAITVRSENGPHHTTIDGEMNVLAFTFHSGEGADSVVDGISIVRGRAGGLSPSGGGGGIRIQSSSPTIKNCIITDCYGNDWGGAIGITDTGSPDSNPTIVGCTFSDNYSDYWGGGIAIADGHTTIVDCVFSANVGLGQGGGLFIWLDAHVTIINSAFVGNKNHAIYIQQSDPSAEIVNCLFSGNSSGNSSGGAIRATDSNPLITNCTFVNNSGGGVSGSATVNNSIFRGNFTTGGASLELFGSPGPFVVNSSNIQGGWTGPGTGNIDADAQFVGGVSGAWTGAPSYDATTNLTTYTDRNAAFPIGSLVGKQFNPDTSQPRHIHIAANTSTTISVPGNFTDPGVGGGPNIVVTSGDAYQVFDWRISAGSPCIDAGHNAAVPAGITTDLDGHNRVVDGDNNGSAVVDMGCYEFLLGDFDGDGTIGSADLAQLLATWGECPAKGACPADLNGDGIVGSADLAQLLAHWG